MDPTPVPPPQTPVVPPPTPAAPPPRGLSCLGCVGILSVLLNVVLVVVLLGATVWTEEDESAETLIEVHYGGDRSADNKVAIVRVAGVLMDGTTGHVQSQVRQAARDADVKAVVVRIESPGGTITASEEVHRALTDLRDNTHPRFAGTGPKPLVASMGNVAASGGYYVAMPAGRVFAEPTTITGSIGVFAALPNVSELASRHGVKVELIRAGNIKAGGSPFQPLRPDERQPWQDMVDHAYDRFLGVVATGRPGLTKERLTAETATTQVPIYDETGLPKHADGKPLTRPHTRYRADGGTFTPPQALALGLIDEVGSLSAAVEHAARVANLGSYRSVTYQREPTLLDTLLDTQATQSSHPLSAEQMAESLTPRIWYLTPGFELAGAASAK